MESLWWLPVGLAIGTAIFLAGLSMLAPHLSFWIGLGITLLGLVIILGTILRYWRYIRTSYIFYEGAQQYRVTINEFFTKWTDEKRREFSQRHPKVYEAISEALSDKMGPPGRPIDKWNGESEAKYFLRLGINRYVGARLYSLGKWFLSK